MSAAAPVLRLVPPPDLLGWTWQELADVLLEAMQGMSPELYDEPSLERWFSQAREGALEMVYVTAQLAGAPPSTDRTSGSGVPTPEPLTIPAASHMDTPAKMNPSRKLAR